MVPLLSRRESLARLGVAGLTAAALPGCTSLGAAPARAGVPQALASGVYWVGGSGGVATPANQGRIGNAGFIVGERGVIAVDMGTSHAHGVALLEAIRSVTPLPVRVALVTHVRPEFLFGGTAFRERGIPVRMQARSAQLMQSRCETCLKVLVQTLGDEAMRGTAMYKPDQLFDASHELELIGRPVRVLHYGHASGPGDIAVQDLQSGVLFTGGLSDAERIPDIQDSQLPGWHAALQQLMALQPSRVVGGHGPAAGAASLGRVQAYLNQLEQRVRVLLNQGESLLDVADATQLDEFSRWDQYDLIHRRNASIAYLRFERELMLK